MWYHLVVAHSPSKTAQTSVRKKDKKRKKFEAKVLELLSEGLRPPEVAKVLAKGDKQMAKRLRLRIWRMVRSDAQFQRSMMERAQAEAVVGVVPASRGLAKRAGRKTDAAKLLFEMTGLHNNKVKHEHSGEISIKLDIPRPKFVDATASDDGETVIGPAD